MSDGLNLSIDENNLLGEWQGQASMMYDYAVQLADAMQEEDEAKAELEVTKADLDSAIRTNPDAYGITKITEAVVSNAIVAQQEYEYAIKAVNDAKHKVRVLKAATDALSHRKSALQGMTDLFLRQWYADPSSSEQPLDLRTAAKAGPPTKTIAGRKKRSKNG